MFYNETSKNIYTQFLFEIYFVFTIFCLSLIRKSNFDPNFTFYIYH